ncbi:MAG: DUF2203 domain-containing protein [Pseudomonadota bacterium]
MAYEDPDTFKVYTVEEANAIVPWLDYQFGRMMMVTSRMEEALQSLVQHGVEPSPAIVNVRRNDPVRIKRLKQRLKRLITEVFDYYSRVQDAGVIIDDISTGTVSFYTYFGEHPVFLTWQFGEKAVTWWHELYEDPDERKPLPRGGSITGVLN